MNNLINVIIITRKSEFVDENNLPIDESSEFGKYISKELIKPKSYYSLGKDKLKRYFSAIKNIPKDEDDMYEYADKAGVDIEANSDIRKELIIRHEEVDEDLTDKRCYVNFQKKPFEIYLLLWDMICEAPDEKVEYFDLFLDRLCEDCGIKGNNNYLYIHDKQYYGHEHQDVELITSKKCEIGCDFFKNHCSYVCIFQHSPNQSSTFRSKILNYKFGDDLERLNISELEKEKESFADIRNEADHILQ